MNEFEKLKRALLKTPVLRCSLDDNSVEFITEGESFEYLGCPDFLMNALNVLAACDLTFSPEEIFDEEGIALLAGAPVQQVTAWQVDRTLTPSLRRGENALYSYSDAFAAAIIGTLVRHRMPVRFQRLMQSRVKSLLALYGVAQVV